MQMGFMPGKGTIDVTFIFCDRCWTNIYRFVGLEVFDRAPKVIWLAAKGKDAM